MSSSVFCFIESLNSPVTENFKQGVLELFVVITPLLSSALFFSNEKLIRLKFARVEFGYVNV